MAVLLDTCALLWWLSGERTQLSDKAFSAINTTPANNLLLSSATMHELAIKSARGLLQLPEWRDLQIALDELGLRILPITARRIAFYTQCAQSPHKDPFDRMIAAQALEHSASVITCDNQFAQFNVEVLW